MNRMDAKMTAPVGLALENDEMVDPAMTGAAESYQSHVKTRLDMQGAVPLKDPASTARALPAWIKTQVEQLEMRRKARHLAAKPELSNPRKTD